MWVRTVGVVGLRLRRWGVTCSASTSVLAEPAVFLVAPVSPHGPRCVLLSLCRSCLILRRSLVVVLVFLVVVLAGVRRGVWIGFHSSERHSTR